MFTARLAHTATRLNSGLVLIAGGYGSNGYLSTAELYTPSTFTPAGLVAITVTPTNPTIAATSFQQFVATGTFSGNSTQSLASVAWSSSATAVASVSNDAGNHGVAVPATAGMTTITASAGSMSGSTALAVQVGRFSLCASSITPAPLFALKRKYSRRWAL